MTTMLGTRFLCLDTCVILDIMRDPMRDDVNEREQAASLELLHAAKCDKRLTSLIAEQVRKEFCDKVDDVHEEAKASLARFRKRVSKLDDLAKLHGSPGQVDLSHLNNHEYRCRKVAECWLNVGTLVPQSEQIVNLAFDRNNQARTPARKGKDSMKDCVILETYIERVRQLRNDGITTPIVFVSSNKNDYAEPNKAVIRADIEDEFRDIGLEYAPNMAAAKHLLKL